MRNRPEFDPPPRRWRYGVGVAQTSARLSVALWSCRCWEGRLRERDTPGTSAEVVNSLMSSEHASVEVLHSTMERSWRTGPP